MAELIAALDFSEKKQAIDMARLLRGTAPWLKIGLELFTACGPQLIAELKELGFKIFLDLKFYDIPNTVAKAVSAVSKYGVDMLTLHCQGGKKMCQAALESACACSGQKPLLAGVTALTSFGDGEMPGVKEKPGEFGVFLACQAWEWGLQCVVCSGWEASLIKQKNPGLLCVCPGIRPQSDSLNDQKRVMAPFQAVRAGADYLVIGRPIMEALDPRAKALEIISEINSAM